MRALFKGRSSLLLQYNITGRPMPACCPSLPTGSPTAVADRPRRSVAKAGRLCCEGRDRALARDQLLAHMPARSELRGLSGQHRMSEPKPRIVTIGEVMIELARGGDGRFALASGGDTFNTSVY